MSVTEMTEARWAPRRRLGALCDRGSLEIVGKAEGVLVGTGTVEGREIVCFVQDGSVAGGSLGVEQADAIVAALHRARSEQRAVIGVIESGGARVQEGVSALAGYSRIFAAEVALRGVVPQIAVVLGASAGGGCYMPALTDLTIMADTARMFLTGPRIVRASIGEEVEAEALGGPAVHGSNGVAHIVAEGEPGALSAARRVMSLLPWDGLHCPPAGDPEFALEDTLPSDPRRPYDVRRVIASLVDAGSVIEIAPKWAPNIVGAFARIGGRPAAVVASQPMKLAGALDAEAAQKAAEIVERASALSLPLLTLADTPGFMPGTVQEGAGIIRHGARLVRAYADARVPLVTVVLRKAFGGAYIAMGSRDLGADLVLAVRGARVGVMGGEQAAALVHRRAIESAADPAAEQARFAAEYEADLLSAEAAIDAGVVDEIVGPSLLRRRLMSAFEATHDERDIWEGLHARFG